jgi:hypothetical protein
MGSFIVPDYATPIFVNLTDQLHPHGMAASIKEAQLGCFGKWWKDLGLRKLLAWQATILVSQMTTGYDESVVGSFQSMKPWVKGLQVPLAVSRI